MSISVSNKFSLVARPSTTAASNKGNLAQVRSPEQQLRTQAAVARKLAEVKDGFDLSQVKRAAVALKAEGTRAPPDVVATAGPSGTEGPAPTRQTLTAEQAAMKEVEIKTVATTQKETEEARARLHEETQNQVNNLFDMAAGKAPIPKNSEVKQTADNQAELVRRNEKGEVVERTVATRQPDGSVVLDSSTFDNGRNVRDRLEANADGGTYAQHAEWPGQNEAEGLKNFGDIDRSKDPNLVYTAQRVNHGPEGQLQIEKYSQAGGAVSGSKTSYHQESLNIDDKLEGDFDRRKPVDTEETYSYSIPAPGPDGKQPNPQYQRTERFSQDQGRSGPIQATAVTNRELNGHVQFAGEGPHSRVELDKVRDEYAHGGDGRGEQYDADDAYKTGQTPKQWLLEKKTSDTTLDTQTFLEGQPKVSTITHTEVNGNTVKQTSKGTVLKPDGGGDFADVEGASTTVYAQDGSIEHFNSASKEPDGTQAIDVYDSQREVTDRGLKLGERVSSTRISPDGKTTKGEHVTQSLISGEGVQLLGARNTTTGPDGSSATTQVDSKGSRLSVTGPGGSDPREVRKPEDISDEALKDLATNSVVALNQQIAEFSANGGANAFRFVQGLSTPNEKGVVALSDRVTNAVGGERLAKVSQGIKGTATAVGGVAGVTAGIAGIIEGAGSRNKAVIARGVFDTIGGAANLYETGEAFKNLFRGKSDLAGAGKWVGGAAQGTGVAPAAGGSSAVSKIGGALKGLGGAANVIGAAVGVATGAIDISEGVKGGHSGQVAKGALGVAGSVVGVAATVLAGSAFGGPVGVAAGAIVGGLILVGQKIIELIADDEHQISQQRI
jgi:hypothetical protein